MQKKKIRGRIHHERMSGNTKLTLPPGPGRLYPTAIPRHYDLHYQSIDLERHTFSGQVSIDVDISASVSVTGADGDNVILLHAIELDILSATYQPCDDGSGAGVTASQAYEFRYHNPTQTCALIFPSNSIQPSSSGKLVLRFQGILNDLMHGLYRSTYTALDGRELTIATTQFEPTDARRAFPCFDEPALKATFKLTITLVQDPTRPGLKAYSNTPILNEYTSTEPLLGRKNADGSVVCVVKTTYEFDVTPKMSTYLVALIVAELDGISTTPTKGATAGVTTTVFTVPGKSQEGRFCLDVASKCLELYATLFGVNYPLSKSDLVAVPDFAAGAMENWGLVTYREAKILVREGSTSESMKRGIARTVCHELAHQWHGNLVTPDFWTQLWLKEGVARYLEFVGIDNIFPEWNAWEEFTQGVYGIALNLDAMISSHPVEVEVQSADEIGEIFDTISYAKGASVIRMISSYVGFETFLKGIRQYLEKHKYGNTVSVDFWQAMEDASGKPVVKLALPWTLQVGYPIVILPQDGNELACPRYLAGGPGSSAPDDDSTTSWPIPVTAIVQDMAEIQGPWLINGPNGDETPALLDRITEWTAADKWFKLNAKQEAFFRVSYTSEQWRKLSSAMSPSGPLSATDRLGLISDSFAAGRAGYASIVDSLALVKDFGEHDVAEYAVWQELSENLAALASLYRAEPFFPKLQQFLDHIYTKQMDAIGWDVTPGDDQRTGTLRSTIIGMMGVAGNETVCFEALKRFKAYVEDPAANAIDGDLRTAVFRTALRADEEYVCAKLKRIYEENSDPGIQRSCLSVLGRVKDADRHAAVLDYALYSGKVRFQDISFVLNGLATTTDEGGQKCWQNFKNDFDNLAARFIAGHVLWGSMIGLTCRGLRTLEEADEVEQFFADPAHPAGAGQRRLEQGLEAVRTNAARLARDRDAVAAFLESAVP